MKRKYGLTPIQRIERRRTITETGCWECDLAPNKPYAMIKIGGKHQSVHRVIWAHYNGPIPDGLCVCHTCDNRRCHNPSHLFLGTYQDNVDDMMAKGRHVIAAKPTIDYSAVIKYSQSGEYSQAEIAKQFDVSQAAISRILIKAGLARGRRTSFRKNPSRENHPRAKLTEQDVAEIRQSKRPDKELAAKYNVSKSTIYAVRSFTNWKE